jgi:hypothetical protein
VALFSAAMARYAPSATFTSFADHALPSRLVQAAVGLSFYASRTVAPVDLQPLHELRIPFASPAPRHVAAVAIVV